MAAWFSLISWAFLHGRLLLSAAPIALALWLRHHQTKYRQIRGLKLVTPQTLNNALHGWTPFQRGICIGSVRIPYQMEAEHFLITGSPGSGKSSAIRTILDQIRKRGQAAVIVDPDAEFTAQYYDEATDLILNPLDQRCPWWSPFLELTSAADIAAMADSIVRERSKELIWADAARALLRKLLTTINTTEALLDAVKQMPIKDRAEASVLFNLRTALEPLRFLPAQHEDFWSARDWATKRKGWIFLSSTAASRAAALPLQGIWLNCLLRNLLSANIGQQHTWIIADEFTSLGPLPELEQAITQGRKRGLCVVIAFQNFAQVVATYSRERAITITDDCKTSIIFQCKADTADRGSELLGGQEIADPRGRPTYRRLVTADEIQSLPEHFAYIGTGSYARTKVKFKQHNFQPKIHAFIPRGADFAPANEATKNAPITVADYKACVKIWSGIKQRCENPKALHYKDYGGRGIKLRFDSLEALLTEVGPRPGENYTLDRKQANGHYEPGNVRWATRAEQNRNKRNSKGTSSATRSSTTENIT